MGDEMWDADEVEVEDVCKMQDADERRSRGKICEAANEGVAPMPRVRRKRYLGLRGIREATCDKDAERHS